MINNEFDVGPAMQPGVFEAAHARNPNIVSWNTSGSRPGARLTRASTPSA